MKYVTDAWVTQGEYVRDTNSYRVEKDDTPLAKLTAECILCVGMGVITRGFESYLLPLGEDDVSEADCN